MFSFALIPFCLCWVVLLLSVCCYSSFLTCLLVDSIRLALAHSLGLCSGPFYIVVCVFSATTVLLRFSHFPYATGVWSTRSFILIFLSSCLFCTFQAVIYVSILSRPDALAKLVGLPNAALTAVQSSADILHRANIMTKCCKCNATGACSACSCVKTNTPCQNCAPGAKHRCKNGGGRGPHLAAAAPLQHNGNDSQNSAVGADDGSRPIGGDERPAWLRRTCPRPGDGASDTTRSVGGGERPAWLRRTCPRPVITSSDDSGVENRAGAWADLEALADASVRHAGAALAGESDRGITSTPRAGPDASIQALDPAAPTNADSPSLVAHPNSSPAALCGDIDRQAFIADISRSYEVVVTWRRNLFVVPYGAAGRTFTRELASLVEAFVSGSALRPIAWKAVTVACHVLLHKPNNSKLQANHLEHLQRRLALWEVGDVAGLLDEGQCIQNHLPTLKNRSTDEQSDDVSDTVFSNLVLSGKIKSAIRYMAPSSSGGVLRMDDVVDTSVGKTVRDVLQEKHPLPRQPPPSVFLQDDPLPVNPILFERITPELIKKISRQMSGSSGPSGMDAEAWCRLLTCFKADSNRLCSALAAMARCICTEQLEAVDLAAFVSARLIPLDKRPGVRPIAVGEVTRRIVCRAIMRVAEKDVLQATAPLQMCVGIPSACEASVHVMERLFNRPDTEGVLFVDAANAFNSLNRKAALHNVARVCPALSKVFCNTYGAPIRLLVSGGGEVMSQEGTCQGDPLAMALYAVAITPLIRRLQKSNPNVTQEWYADDDAAAGTLPRLRRYWRMLEELGPGYGYFPNAQKTVLLVKPDVYVNAVEHFTGTDIQVVSSGSRYLGGAVGSQEFCQEHMARLADGWGEELRNLAALSKTQPQAAYTVFSKGLAGRWQYHLRCSSCPGESLSSLDKVIDEHFLPALLGHNVAPASGGAVRRLLALPVRFGGLAVPVFASMAGKELEASVEITKSIVDSIIPSTPVISDQVDPVIPSEKCRLQSSLEADTLSIINLILPSASASSDQMDPVVPSQSCRMQSSLKADAVACPDRLESSLAEDAVIEAVAIARGAASNNRSRKQQNYRQEVASISEDLTPGQRLLTEIAMEKGISSWLTVAPSYENSTVLNKSDFRDALSIRYGFELTDIPDRCVCGAELSTSHAFTCPAGGYPTARHNEVRDLTAGILREAGMADVEVEPKLLPYEGEDLPGRMSNIATEARLDVRARGFWSRQQDAYFDVRVTHPAASLLSRSEVRSQLKRHEKAKKKQYGPRVVNVQRGVFTPLVFATNGMCGPETEVFLKSLAALIVDRNKDLRYSVVMGLIRCRISFCLLRWSITSFRGCRASYTRHRPDSFLAQC